MTIRIAEHVKENTHAAASMFLLEFQQDRSINAKLKQQTEKDTIRWKEVLTVQTDVLQTLTSLILPLRGKSTQTDRADCGFYLSIIKLLARYHLQLHEHLNFENRIMYLNNTIMEKLVRTLANKTRCKMLEVEKAGFWSYNRQHNRHFENRSNCYAVSLCQS